MHLTNSLRQVLVSCLAVGGACVGIGRFAQDEYDSRTLPETLGARVHYIQGMLVDADEDEHDSVGVQFVEADVERGRGKGVGLFSRAGDGAIRIDYFRTDHRDALGNQVEVHQAVASYWYGPTRLIDHRDFTLVPRFGIGVGGMVLEFESNFDDVVGLAGTVGGELEITIFELLNLNVGIHGFLWGYPSETIGTGGILVFGGGFEF